MSRLDEIVALATRQTERDKQTTVGPSSLGKSCEVCLARDMLGIKPDVGDTSLFPMYGTSFHNEMEHRASEEVRGSDGHLYITEQRVYVGDIEGYGPVHGNLDLYYNRGIVDYKLVGKNTRVKARMQGPSQQYIYQVQCYGTGAVNEGLEVDSVGICFFPRDTGKIKDIYLWEAKYDPTFAERALDRASRLWDYVTHNGLAGLESDDDCWTCKNVAFNINWEDSP